MTQKEQVPALDGWFIIEGEQAYLLGSQCKSCGTYYFPKQSNFCKNPACNGEEFEQVPLSRTGKIWSFTNACYQPPEPYIAADPYVPFTIAAVELDKEKMIVLGQVVEGVNVSDLKAGMEMELVVGQLSADEKVEKLIWKWKPVSASVAKKGAN